MDSERLLSKARSALSALRAFEATGLAEESAEETAARVLDVKAVSAAEGAAAGSQIWVASDGLTLDAKLAIERGLTARLGQAEPVLSVYFKRRAPADGAPAAARNQSSPFGLKINKRAVPGVAQIIAVASGKGGVGKSTVASNLAVALQAQGKSVGLLDADVYGPSAPMMMGAKGPLGVKTLENGTTKLVPVTAHGVPVVSFGFLTDAAEPVIWRGPLVAKALKQLFYDVDWGELDYLIVDLPPGTGDVQMTMIESVPIYGAVIVTTPQDVALLDAQKALTMFEKLGVPILGLVENMAHFHCSNCGHEERIFGDGGGVAMAAARKVRLLAQIPLERFVRERGDAGIPAVTAATDQSSPAARAFVALAAQISAPTFGH